MLQSNLSVPGSASNSPRHGSMDRPTNPIIQTAIDRDSLECSFSSDEAVRLSGSKPVSLSLMLSPQDAFVAYLHEIQCTCVDPTVGHTFLGNYALSSCPMPFWILAIGGTNSCRSYGNLPGRLSPPPPLAQGHQQAGSGLQEGSSGFSRAC